MGNLYLRKGHELCNTRRENGYIIFTTVVKVQGAGWICYGMSTLVEGTAKEIYKVSNEKVTHFLGPFVKLIIINLLSVKMFKCRVTIFVMSLET